MSRLEASVGNGVIKHRWLIIIITILMVVASGYGARFLTFNNDNRIFFSEENPQLQALEALENTYNSTNNVLFVIAPKNGNVFTRKMLGMVEELTEAAWRVPYSSRVESITNFQHIRSVDDDLTVEDLVENAERLSDLDILRIKKISLSEPILMGRLISPSGHVTSVTVTVLLPNRSMDEVPEVVAFVRKMADDFRRKYPGVDIYLTGGIMFDNAFAEATESDITTLVPAMFLALLVMIGLALRSFASTLATLFVILFSAATGMGLAGWLGMSLNPASANAPTIILILAVADSVHILATIRHQIHQGKNKMEAIVESLRINLQPVFLTSATTAIGFLSMNFSDAPPFRDLGNLVALGVIAAFAYSILFLPALLAVLPVRVRARTTNSNGGELSCQWLADFVVEKRKLLFYGLLTLSVLLTAGITLIELNDDWIKYFDQHFDVRKATDFAQDNLTGFYVIEYSLDSGEKGGINNPDYLSTVEEFTGWYRKQPNIAYVSTITDTMKLLNKSMHGDDESYYRIPEQRDLAAQYLLLYELSLPLGLDLNNQINIDKSSTLMIIVFKDFTTKEVREMDRRAREWLKLNAPETMFTYGSGLSVIWAHISQRNINSMLVASFIALVLISGILILALKSFKLGILSLVPNLSPALMAFGLWGLTVGQVGLGLSVVVAMTLGIVVDDTVHFMSKYIRARQEYDLNPADAVRYAFHTVGTAMWVTTVALVSGFLVLTFSGYRMNSDMGLMTAITITIALIMDFFFLPTLLMKVERRSENITE
jgi:predicted RND superfamily exporter protein